MTGKIFTSFLLILIMFLIYQMAPLTLSSEEIRFVVPLNEAGGVTVLERLKNEKIIRNLPVFQILSVVSKIPPVIEPGAYKIKRNLWLPQIVNILMHNPYQKWALLKPGLRKEQVAEILAKNFKWDKSIEEEFLSLTEEGFLFPDTYLFDVEENPQYFINKIKNNFNEKFNAKFQADLLARDVRNDTAIKIASLIERESGTDDDKALIAGIIWNRLETDMKLQIDATSQYILGKPGDWWPRIKPADHKRESPYNTYLYKGLPPGPISNPSLASIKAAVYPAQTECLYYIHDKNKLIHCSKTYEEHLEYINQYLK